MHDEHRPGLRFAYVPFFETTVEKGYTVRMRESLAAFGRVERFDGIAATWRRHRRRFDWLVLNWTDNDLLDRRTKRVALRKVVKLFAKTALLRLAARRLLFVRHNVYPHAVAAGGEQQARRWVDRYERLFDVVLTHSGDAGQRGRHYCPHPLYHLVDTERATGLPPDASWGALPPRYHVVFGRIVRYKQIERLIDAFPDDQTLLVFGAVGDPAYANELAARAPPNVMVRPGLVDEAEAQAIVAGSATLLISHAEPDVVVSSSFFFAMSVGTPVIAVATPFLQWIAGRIGPALLQVAPDVTGLCALTRQSARRPLGDAERESIDREFGDAAVHAALRRALRL